MAKIWKVIGIVAGIALLLGLICVGVGFITGGDLGRIRHLLENNYGLDNLRSITEDIISRLIGINPIS